MNNEKFFTTIWKINAFILLILGIFGIVSMLIIGYIFIKEATSSKTITKVINTKNELKHKLGFSHVINLPNTPYAMLPLEDRQDYNYSYYTKSAIDSVRNYIFIDTQTGFNNWLLPTNKYLILNFYLIDEKNPKAIVYEVIKKDTNKDSFLTKKDKKILAISSPDGGDFKELIDGVDRYLGKKFLDEKLILFYEKESEGYSLHVNLAEFTAIKEINLAKIKDKK